MLANRLTEQPEIDVLLVEAGPPDCSIFIHMPSAFAYPLAGDTYNWAYETEPEPHMDGRRVSCPRGRVLGGSSSINGMVYIRGHALDYDGWAAASGLEHWSYAHCLPYFKRAETRFKGADDYRGGGGPLYVTTGEMKNPLYRAFIEAGRQAGYATTDDMNGYRQEGLGPMDLTTYRGRRWSAAMAYLRPARARANLRIEPRCLVTRVAVRRHARRRRRIPAQRPARPDAGAPRGDRLRRRDQFAADPDAVRHRRRRRAARSSASTSWRMFPASARTCRTTSRPTCSTRARSRSRCTRRRTSSPRAPSASNGCCSGRVSARPTTSNPAASSGAAPASQHPDLQYHFLPIAITYDGKEKVDQHGFQAHVGPMRPTSRGTITLASANPREAPRILFNYLATEGDRREFRDAIRLTREIFAQKAFDPFRGAELSPGPAVTTDAEIDAHIRRKAESAYHPSCSCKMGADDDPMAVVDGSLRVRGTEGLRVVDASIMPAVVSGNLNAPTIMIGEKAADIIRGRTPLPPADVPVFVHPEWRTKQR